MEYPSGSFLIFYDYAVFPNASYPCGILVTLVVSIIDFSSVFVVYACACLLLSYGSERFEQGPSCLALVCCVSSLRAVLFQLGGR